MQNEMKSTYFFKRLSLQGRRWRQWRSHLTAFSSPALSLVEGLPLSFSIRRTLPALLRFAFCSLLLTIGYSLFAIRCLYAGVPERINIQGRLTDEKGVNKNAPVDLTLTVYDQSIGGTILWREFQSQVQVVNGNFQTHIGKGTKIEGSAANLSDAFSGTGNRYLGIQVGIDPELIPRQQLVTVPYAFTANNGVPKGAIVMWSGTLATIPAGWALCDGTQGTPNLSDNFILATSPGENPGSNPGGSHSITLSVNQLPSHSHTGTTNTTGRHKHQSVFTQYGPGIMAAGTQVGLMDSNKIDTTEAGDHSHTLTINPEGGGAAFDNRPAYYKLAFIMKL